VLESHPQVVKPKGAEPRIESRQQNRNVDPIVLGQKRHPFFDAAYDLTEKELDFIARLIALHPFFTQRSLLNAPGCGNSFAGLIAVEVVARFNGAVDIDESVQIRRKDGADFHGRK
jgi:hypothetical protein